MKGATAVDKTVIRLIGKSFPSPQGVLVAVPGDGQGGPGRLLAEKGYAVQDGDLSAHDVKAPLFDAVILHGAVERRAFPEDVILQASSFLKKGGLLVITASYGGSLPSGPPLFEEVWQREKRAALAKARAREGGDGPLFLFTRKSLRDILTNDLLVEKEGRCGGAHLYLAARKHPLS